MPILRYYHYYYQCYAYEPLYVFMSARTTTSILTSRGRPSMMPDTQEAGRPQCGRPQCQLFGLPWGLLASEGFSFRTDRSSGFRVALSVGSKYPDVPDLSMAHCKLNKEVPSKYRQESTESI